MRDGVTHSIYGAEPGQVFYTLEEFFEYLERESETGERPPGDKAE